MPTFRLREISENGIGRGLPTGPHPAKGPEAIEIRAALATIPTRPVEMI
jgi:hypothetical protein